MATGEFLGPDLQRIVSATYDLLMISVTYDKRTTTADVFFRKSYIIHVTETRFPLQNYHIGSVCLPFSDVGKI